MVTMRTTRTNATLFFDTKTNLEGGSIPGREGGDDFDGNNDYDKNNGNDFNGHKDTTMTEMMMKITTLLDAFLAGGGEC